MQFSRILSHTKEGIALGTPSSNFFEVAWSKHFGRGLIDCHYDSTTDTISVCDLSGLTVMSDSSGQELVRTVFDMPAWGVMHKSSPNGFVVACALADKVNDRGAVVLRCDSVDLFRVDYEVECWDVYLTEEFLYWTMWDGRCGRVRLSDLESGADYIDLGASAYGLSAYGEKIFAVAQGIGVLQVDDGTAFAPKLILSDSNTCYNTTYNAASSKYYAGSSGNSPVVQGANFTVQRSLHRGICGIAVFGDFLLVGSLVGELMVLAPSTTSHYLSLCTLKLQDGIWNLSVVPEKNILYIACGDGSLYCVTINEQSTVRLDAQTIELALENLKKSYDVLFKLSSISAIVLASTIVEERWDKFSDDEIEAIGKLLQQWAHYLSDDRINYLLGLYYIYSNQFDDAIVALQRIDSDQEYFVKSLMPLSKAFEGITSLSSAIRILQSNLGKIPEQQVPPFLFRIGELHELCGDPGKARQAFETLSFYQHSYKGVQDALQRLEAMDQLSLMYSKRSHLRRIDDKKRVTFEQVMKFDALNREIYIDLREQYKYMNIVPFIGAGMSVIAGFPVWELFLRNAYKEYSDFLDGSTELPSDLMRAASKLYNCLGNSMFYSLLKKTFGGNYSEDDWQRIINQAQYEANGLLPNLFRDAVITTNFDRFLERLYPSGTIISHPHHPAQLNRAIRDKTPIIVKLHGCISEPEKIILTQKAYANAYPKSGATEFTIALEKFLTNKTLLFLGCSLGNDATIKYLTKIINSSQGMGIDHFAIVGCKSEERISRRKELSKKGIFAITYDSSDGSNHDAVREILQQLQVDTSGGFHPNNLFNGNGEDGEHGAFRKY